ncbi:MAG TPA: type IV toxin-antitoxin system AbiEi family antitoxin domain-containing protein [Acidothermaceae bacterium]|nr:type IV toxin-antitoxin system AbiEi family antitoxin domain-containing protein [Acidothermaceae bacterium]
MDIPPSLAAQVGNQYGLFTAAQALEVGFDHEEIRRRLGRGDWSRVRRGIYCEASTLPSEPIAAHIFRVRAAMMRLKPPVAVSHLSAAAVDGIDLLDPDFSMIQVTRPDIGSSRTDAGIHHHNASLLARHVKRELGLVITTAARTVVDLARETRFEQGVVAAEYALNKGLVTRAGLLEVHTFCLDWPGSRNAGRVIQFASEKSESPGESLGRVAFEAVGLPAPKQQVKFYDRQGLIGVVDFLWDEQSTIGEFDGRLKYTGQLNANVLYDEKRREDRLRALGFEIVRFGYHGVRGGRAELHRAVLDAFARSEARRGFRNLG